MESDAQKKQQLSDETNALPEITANMSENARLLGLCKENEKVKVVHFFCKRDRQQIIIPFDAFLFNHSIHIQSPSNDLEIIHEIRNPDTRKCHVISCSLNIPQCKTYFCAGIARSVGSDLQLIQCKYSDGIIRPSIYCETRIAPDQGPIPTFTFNISQIIPQTCKHCGIYQEKIKKCKGCWENLRLRVYYCSKECQTIDFNRGRHKDVCGCRNHGAVNKRLREIAALGLDPESAFRS